MERTKETRTSELREAEITETMSQAESAWKALVIGLPGVEIVEKPGLSIRWADVPFPFWNVIVSTERHADATSLESRLAEASTYMKQKRHGGFLLLCEEYLSGSAKERLPAILQKTGLEIAMPATGMTGEFFPLKTSSPPSLRIERVTDLAALRELADVNCSAYGFPKEWGDGALDPKLLIDEGYSYLGYVDNQAVSGCTVYANDGVLYVALVATRPEAQGKGYGEATLRRALQAAHEATGISRSILHATQVGRPVYHRIGFHDTATVLILKRSA